MKTLNKANIIIAVITLVVGFALGWLIFGKNQGDEHHHDQTVENHTEIWTCSMHPQIRQSEPGQCPICGMDLIPLDTDSSEDNPLEIKMSPTAMQLANVQTSVIKKQKPVKEIRLNGKVQADERYVSSQSSHISGRIEKLLVNYVGEYISKGQVIANIYSPELVMAQEELFEAYKIRDTQPELYQASREKLKNWKLDDSQIDGIIEHGSPTENFPIRSDLDGVVLKKRANPGDYVRQGASLFEVANLSKIWVLFDVYESDIQWVKKKDELEFTIQSLPGEKFRGKISFIDPVINPKTRVAKARIAMNNRGQRLKPEMFASGVLKSPMQNGKTSIIIPKSAIMWTGERSVVYVKTSSTSSINFIMREVTLGASLGDSYIIIEGLEEGEEIATNGTFSIDAAAQLAGKPSMMNPKGGAVMTGHNHGVAHEMNDKEHKIEVKSLVINSDIKKTLSPLYESYLFLKDALVHDDFKKAKEEAVKLKNQLKSIDMAMFEGEAHLVWMEHGIRSVELITELAAASDIESVRKTFKPLSGHMIQLAKTFDPFEKQLFIQHCPMADDFKGADWLSTEKNVMNPYYGESMLTCGEAKEL